MRLDLHPILPSLALAALALASVACSDDGVPTQQSGSTGADDGNGSSGISTTMTAGSMTGPGGDGLDDGGTGLGTTGAPPPGTGTTDEPGDSTAAEDGTASDTGSSSGGTGSESSSGSGSDSGSSSDSGGEPLCDASARPGELPVGSACPQDSACESGVCYDFADYDALCGGTACSVCCETDDDCVAAMQTAGAPFPGQTFCLSDGRCDMVGTGLGGPFFCAGG